MSIQKTTTELETLKINYLTQEMYEDALQNGEINEGELYFTPDEETDYLPLTGGTVSGNTTFENSVSIDEATIGDLIVTGSTSLVNTAVVNAGTDYTTSRLRNVMLSTTAPASTVGNNGDICIIYTA